MAHTRHQFPAPYGAVVAALLLGLCLAGCGQSDEPLGHSQFENVTAYDRCVSYQDHEVGEANKSPVSVYGPLRDEPPVSVQMGYASCSDYAQQAGLELDPELLVPSEPLRIDETIDMNMPLDSWLDHSAGFNSGAMMDSLCQLIARLEELIALLTGRDR